MLWAVALLLPASAFSAALVQPSFVENAGPPPTLAFSFRLSESAEVTGVRAQADGGELPTTFKAFAESDDASLAVLYLVDASWPGKRDRSLAAIKKLLGDLAAAAPAGTSAAVYSFATDLKAEAPFGAPPEEFAAKVDAMALTKGDTLLYEYALRCVQLLAGRKAARKALVILSDGDAEDPLRTPEDVVAAARDAGVTIDGVGFAERTNEERFLQSLMVLSRDTGGEFVRADTETKALPETFASDFFGRLASGGTATVDASGLEPGKVVVTVVTAGGELTAGHAWTIAPEPSPTVAPAEVPSPSALKGEGEGALWIPFAGAGVGLLAIVVILALVLRKRPAPPEDTESAAPLASLEIMQPEPARYEIATTNVRLGRGRDNDVCFTNDSVSAHHAVIQRKRDGAFLVTDLEAGNGTYVNGESVQTKELVEGDVLELGEVKIRFHVAAEPELPTEEPTD